MAAISAAAGTTDGIVVDVTVVEPGMVPGTMGVAAIDAAAGITAILGIATTVVVRLLRSVIIAPAVIADKCLSS